MLAHRIRSFTMRDLPGQLSFPQVDRGNPPPRWFDEGQSLDLQVRLTFGVRRRVRVSRNHRAVVVHCRLFRVVGQSDWKDAGARRDVEYLGFRIERASAPVRSTGHIQHEHGARPFPLADHRRREDRTDLVVRYDLDGLRAKLRGEIDQIVYTNTLSIERRRLGWKRLRWGIPFARYVSPRYRPLL